MAVPLKLLTRRLRDTLPQPEISVTSPTLSFPRIRTTSDLDHVSASVSRSMGEDHHGETRLIDAVIGIDRFYDRGCDPSVLPTGFELAYSDRSRLWWRETGISVISAQR